ncbi:MAG TPA: hypothetical protein VJM34_06790 [Novosphingobium sp.]|nr:hypothetical protein [Novosphingobium sp.]
MKKLLIAAVLMGTSLTSGAVLAQDAATAAAANLKVGAKVLGPEGAEVGTIEKIEGGNVVVFTGKNRATLPGSAFATKGPDAVIGMSKEQLDAAVEAATAKADASISAALVPDASVKTKDGVVVGLVRTVEGDAVIVDLADGKGVTLKKEHFTADAEGLKLVLTAAEFQTAVGSATAASTSADAGKSQPAG